jgi:hypothetical protein
MIMNNNKNDGTVVKWRGSPGSTKDELDDDPRNALGAIDHEI